MLINIEKLNTMKNKVLDRVTVLDIDNTQPVTLSNDECQLLSLGPKFAVTPKVDDDLVHKMQLKIQLKSGNFATNSILYLKINNSEVFNLFSFDSVVQVKRSCYFTLIQSTINTIIRIKQCSSRLAELW